MGTNTVHCCFNMDGICNPKIDYMMEILKQWFCTHKYVPDIKQIHMVETFYWDKASQSWVYNKTRENYGVEISICEKCSHAKFKSVDK